MTIAILKTQAKSKILSPNTSLHVTKIKDFLYPYFSYGKISVNNNIKRNKGLSL